jgi:chromosomal replication initiator protein
MSAPQPITMKTIAADVCARHGLAVDDLLSPDRKRRIAHPRQEFMWRCRQIYWASGGHRYSLPQIGVFLGCRDHTTVLHGVRAHEARLEAEAAP